MPRYKLVIEYDGTPFVGWQRQINGRSVQQAVEEAIEGFAGHAVRLHCAGRTDAGVHASHQVAHMDLEKEWLTDTVRDATNAHLKPEPVSVLETELTPDSFHARTSATKRPVPASSAHAPRTSVPRASAPTATRAAGRRWGWGWRCDMGPWT